MKNLPNQSRRDFIKKTSLIGSSMAAIPFLAQAGYVNTSVDDSIQRLRWWVAGVVAQVPLCKHCLQNRM
jgi:hypothetical protein